MVPLSYKLSGLVQGSDGSFELPGSGIDGGDGSGPPAPAKGNANAVRVFDELPQSGAQG